MVAAQPTHAPSTPLARASASPAELHAGAPLLDGFGRVHTYLRISVTERCNLRCVYCMPAEGVPLKPRESILSYEEILRLARVFARLGIRKVRLTGGEPLVRRDLVGLVAELKRIPGIETVGITTNGVVLADHLMDLRTAGLDQINLSLDTLQPERFRLIALRDDFARVWAALERALELGYGEPERPLKLNVVVMRGVNDDEMPTFVELTRERPIRVRFIEFMPFDGNAWSKDKLLPFAEMRDRIAGQFRLERDPADSDPHNTAREFIIPGHAGNVGFITSMTNDFCGGCNRVRLTADGNIKACLFHDAEYNLRDRLRAGADDAELERLIRLAIAKKSWGHAPIDELAASPNRSMIRIGG